MLESEKFEERLVNLLKEFNPLDVSLNPGYNCEDGCCYSPAEHIVKFNDKSELDLVNIDWSL